MPAAAPSRLPRRTPGEHLPAGLPRRPAPFVGTARVDPDSARWRDDDATLRRLRDALRAV